MTLATPNRHKEGPTPTNTGDRASNHQKLPVSLPPVSSPAPAPIVLEVLRFEDVPLGSLGTRRAVVRWSDGTESDAMTWYSDEILVCEGDLIGKTREQLRSLHFGRDRNWLQS